MSNSTIIKLNSGFFFMLVAWFLLLAFPLLKIIPAPSSNPAHPWQTEFIATVILFAALVLFASQKINVKLNLKMFIPFLLFIAWSGVSVFWAKSDLSVAHHTFLWFAYLFFFILFLLLLQRSETRRILVPSIAVVLVVIAFLCIFDLLTIVDFKSNEDIFRVRYGKYGEMLIMVTPAFWALSLQIKNRCNLFLMLAIGVLLWLAVLFSLSKGAFLAGFFSFFIFFLASSVFTGKHFDRRKTLILFFVWLMVTFASQISFNPNSKKISTADYLTGNAQQTSNTNTIRIFIWNVGKEMISDNWTFGVGADNFGLRFNESRASYVAQNPADKNLAMAEDYFVQRAHNEFLQIFSELGFVGISLFIFMGAGFFRIFARAFIHNGYRFPPLLWGCIAGLSGFLASSMVSSFSFRVMPNGIVFFFMLALAINEANKILKRKKAAEPEIALSAKPSLGFAFAVTSMFFVVSLTANASNLMVALGEQKAEISAAEPYFQNAVRLNSENSTAYFSHGLKYYFDRQPEKAVPLLEKAVENGFDVSIAYFYLSAAQNSAGQLEAAENTFHEALSIYPLSVFLRVRYAVFLQKSGREIESAEQLQIARRLDEKQTDGWFALLNRGAREAALQARAEKTFPEPMELLPTNAVYAAIDEQHVENLFPESFASNK